MQLQIDAIKAFQDNYIWVIHDNKNAIVVDPGESKPTIDFLDKNNLKLNAILITHHHYDHIDGVEKILEERPCQVFAPNDKRIEFNHQIVAEGDSLSFDALGLELSVLETPGHTLTHVCYHDNERLFCGDTLFSIGCGRMFEGTPEVFVNSLEKLKVLADSLKVYCTHEYTLANIQFAKKIEPQSEQLIAYEKSVMSQRDQGLPSVPVILGQEIALNPFLKTNDVYIKQRVAELSQSSINSQTECFAQMRKMKDSF